MNRDESVQKMWVELVGEIIIARIRGVPDGEMLRECQQRVGELHRDTGCSRVMYDALELERPPLGAVLTQQALSEELKASSMKVAIVVPNTAIAYLARLAFGEANHRVFYNDVAAAVRWLDGK